MKKIILSIISLISCSVFSQVIVNADPATALASPSSPSVLLEFGNDDNKGIILPYVETLPTNAVGGTVVFDASSNSQYKVLVKNQNNSGTGWIDLSVQPGYSAAVETQVKQPQSSPVEAATAKVIIGAPTSPADGILVLESSNKAMVLPKVTDVNNIPSPSPGMMVFVTGTAADGSGQRLAVFNGTTWAFWKP